MEWNEMKVVLFCGGTGMRMREYSDVIPKPMVPIGYRPLLWHLMKYYAHFGHREFILCLGYGADHIKQYFLNYDECVSNDFTLSGGGKSLELARSDIHDWRISFVDTGAKSNVGERLRRVRQYVKDEEVFLANYSDGLSDLPLDEYLEYFKNSGRIAAFISVRPTHSFHVVKVQDDGTVKDISDLPRSGLWINGGFFIFRKEIFDYMREGEELVHEPFRRLIGKGELISYRYDGFWTPMDTFKDKQLLDDLNMADSPPWEVWKRDDGDPQ
jgi:glucose-1-phosphate cytidylyltransferase